MSASATNPILPAADNVPPTTDEIHGLNYSPDFLAALPVLLPRPAPHQPIRAISAAQFSEIHLRNLLTHAPDSALFPFLHGLEGDNEAQNSFFRSYGGHPKRTDVPRFRGLIWVACDDEDISQSYQSSPVYSDDDLDDDDFSSEIDCDDGPEVETFAMDIDNNCKEDEMHMHPVHHRTNSIADSTTPMYTVDYAYSHDRRPSTASSFSASSIASPASTTFSNGASFTSDPSLLKEDNLGGYSKDSPVPVTPSPPPRATPTLLTSSFHASELLVKGEFGPELVYPRVPAGISLRNFGIQVVSFNTRSEPKCASLLWPLIRLAPARIRLVV